MRVLVLEGEPGSAVQAIERLTRAGHEVARCHDPGAKAFPCNGMIEGRSCPLEDEGVDVAVVVRGHAHPDPMPGEDGVRCALRRYVPLVVVGHHEQSPYLEWATAISQGPETVVHAVEHAAVQPLARHQDAARVALREVLDNHELADVAADAEVTRQGGDLHVTLRPSATVPTIVNEMASVRTVTAIRAFDPYPDVIDVTVEVPDPTSPVS